MNDVVTRDDSFFTDIENPFVATQNNSIGDSNSRMSYSFDWSSNSGDFLVQGTQTAGHPTASLVISETQGGVGFSPSVDTTITAIFHLTYNLPGFAMSTANGVYIVDVQTNEPIAQLSFYNISAPFPVSGTFDQAIQAMLPAGGHYAFGYETRLDTGTSDVLARNNFSLQFALAPVPEPATLGLLTLGGAMIPRRRPR